MIMPERNDPADLQALKDEVNNDPAGRGYAAVLENIDELVALINEDIGASFTIDIEDLNVSEVAEAVDVTEYGSLAEYDKEWIKMLINKDEEVMLMPYRSKFLSVFPGGGDTRTAVVALLNRSGSRAEVLFGINTEISRQDWIAARDS